MKSLNAVYNILSTNTALNAQVNGRINPLRIAKNSELPAISYFQVSLIPKNTKSGYSKTDFARVQINIFGLTIQSCNAVSELVRTAMEINPGTFGGVYVHQAQFDNEVPLSDDSAGEEGIYHVAQDYIINYNRQLDIADFKLLLENGSFMLLENGDKILL